jgi:hypothetical protein
MSAISRIPAEEKGAHSVRYSVVYVTASNEPGCRMRMHWKPKKTAPIIAITMVVGG